MVNAPALNITAATDEPHNTVYQAVLKAYKDNSLTHLEINTSEVAERFLSQKQAYNVYESISEAASAASSEMTVVALGEKNAYHARWSFVTSALEGDVVVIDNHSSFQFEDMTAEESREFMLNAAAATKPGLIVSINY